MLYLQMKRLIEKKYYAAKEEAQQKLDVFYAKNRLTDEQYEELTDLVNTVYSA